MTGGRQRDSGRPHVEMQRAIHAAAAPSARRRAVLAGLLAGAAGPLSARSVPPAPRGIIVPFGPGHVSDLTARHLAELWAREASGAVLVENHAGGGGVVAVHQLLRRPPDGSALLLGHSGLVCNLPLLSKVPLDFDPQADLAPVGIIAKAPFLLVAGRDHPAVDVASLEQHGRSAREPLVFASSDIGSASHIAGEVLFRRLGLAAVNVPYRNNREAVVDVAEGRVPVGLFNLPLVSGLLESGRMRALALLSDTTLPAAPGIRTLKSQGFGGFDVEGWIGLFAAARAPAATVDAHAARLKAAFDDRGFVDALGRNGLIPWWRDRAASAAHIAADIGRYRRLLETYRIG